MADRGRVGYGSDTRDLLCQHQEEYMSVQTGRASGENETMRESLKEKYEVTRMKDTALKEKDEEGRMLSSSVNEKERELLQDWGGSWQQGMLHACSFFARSLGRVEGSMRSARTWGISSQKHRTLCVYAGSGKKNGIANFRNCDVIVITT